MGNITKLATGLLLLALAIGFAVPNASAGGFTHPRGLIMQTYPYQILVFWTASEQVSVQLILLIMPPFYFAETDGLDRFDTVTLKATLKEWYTTSTGVSPTLLQDTATGQWTNVVIEQDGDGAINGAYLLHTVTFVLPTNTACGWYWLDLNAVATTGEGRDVVTFVGFDHIPVAVRPGGGPPPGQWNWPGGT
jgi:hypothetical protein